MRKLSLIQIGCVTLGATLALSLGFLVFSSGSDGYRPRRITVKDPAFAMSGFIATQGTNHTVNRGNALLCGLNRALMQMGLRGVGEARQLTHVTAQDTTVLWVTFKYPNPQSTAGPPYLAALLTDPRGVTGDPIFPSAGMTDPKNHYDFITAWKLPAPVTNYTGWVFQIVWRRGGEKVVNLDL